MFFSPLESFEIFVYSPIYFSEIDLTLTNFTITLILIFLSMSLIYFLGLSYVKLIPSHMQYVLESLYLFILSLLKEQTHNSGLSFFPLFHTIFLIILFSNLVGLVPFNFTVSSHFSVTFGLALSLNIGILIIGFLTNGFNFLKLFVPKGAPIFLLPLIIIIEIVSYFIRTFSLSIRLFANMMAGHTLLHILATFCVRLSVIGSIWLFPFLLIIGVLALEFGIVFIQAYVFTILVSIYLNDSYHPSH